MPSSTVNRSVLHLAACAAIIVTAAAANLRETKPQARALGRVNCNYGNQNLVAMPTADLTSCNILNVGVNQLTSIGLGDLESLPQLWVAQLGSNDISTIAPNALGKGCSRMQELYLTSNSLSTLGANDFSQISRIGNLRLDHNQISSIAPTAFSGVGSMIGGFKWLDLSDNALTSVASGDFVGAHNLLRLLLNNNAVTSIETGVIDTMTNLRTLGLRDNLISAIPANFFASGVTAMTKLDLGLNALTSISATDFSGLTGLTALDLASNPISAISPNAFDVMPALSDLNLDGVAQAVPCAEANPFCYVIHTYTDTCFCPPACSA